MNHLINVKSPIHKLSCKEEVEQLTNQEKMYAYHFYKAVWEGAKICYFQRSYESPAIFLILQLTLQQDIQTLKQKFLALQEECTEENYQKIVVYIAAFLSNCGNYKKSFGDTKFVPDVEPETFYKFLQCSENYSNNSFFKTQIDSLWNDVKTQMFAYEGFYEKLDFPDQGGFSGYYSNNLKTPEIQDIDELLSILNISCLNTRVIKNNDQNFTVLVASANKLPTLKHHYKGKNVSIVSGEFSPFLRRLCVELEKAQQYSANSNQSLMIQKYLDTFNNGDIESHKESQRIWVKDQGPVIETNVGFIETYLDPRQMRAEWEGFVAVVDKKMSEKTNNLVNNASVLLDKFSPWPKEFEKDQFLKPDFTSLSVLTFASSGVPLGINIPNYDDVRQDIGFKNVYLANCLPIPKLSSMQFLDQADAEIIVRLSRQVQFQKVSYHELLGHGCGKLFQEDQDGKLNFDQETVIHPLTKQKISSWYKNSDTWSNVFVGFSNPYEECRADSIALYFSCFKEATEILIPEDLQHFDDLMYASWLDFVYAGVQSLAFFSVDDNKWGQAHMRGRFVILQVLIEAGNNLVVVEKCQQNGKDWISIKLDRSQIQTTGLQAIKKFLLKLNVYKATADVQNGKQMFDDYSNVNEKFREIRQIVLDNKNPRRLELQGHMVMQQGQVKYVDYDESFEGIIKSHMDRYPYFDQDMFNYWNEYKTNFRQKLLG